MADSAFVMVPSISGTPGAISLRSVNYPNAYLRHQGWRLKLSPDDGSQLMRLDASFAPRHGLAGQGWSFESVNFPGHYIRHSDFHLWVGKNDGSPLFAKDASFWAQPALSATTVMQNAVSQALQDRFNGSRGILENLIRQHLGRGDMIARGVTLYDLNPRIGGAHFQFTGPNTFRYAVSGNHLYFKSTQPTAAGSYADPAFEVNFDLLVTGILLPPTVPGQKPRVDAVIASVPSLTIKSRNLVGGIVLTVVNFFAKTPQGKQLIKNATDQYLRQDITRAINDRLAQL
jgi:hypothetical protein